MSFPFLQPRKQRADGRDGSGELRNPVLGGLHGLTIPVFTNLAHLIITSVSGSASSETNSVGLFVFFAVVSSTAFGSLPNETNTFCFVLGNERIPLLGLL